MPLAECEAMIAGMETDAADRLRLPDEAALDLYCRRVAGSVGAMSVRVFGAPEAERFGLDLGRTFQLTNILRDVDEDALRERVYVPLDMLAAAGIAGRAGFRHRGASALRRDLRGRWPGAPRPASPRRRRNSPRFDARALLPARVMMWGYRRLLERMAARGWAAGARPRPRLSRAEKGRMAWMALGLGRA